MSIPQLNPASKMNSLVTRILQKLSNSSNPNKFTEAEKIFKGIGGVVARSQLRKKVIERLTNSSLSDRIEGVDIEGARIEGVNVKNTLNLNSSIPDFLKPTQTPRPPFKLPDRQKFLDLRQTKWQMVSENLAKMDTVILKEYRERRRENKGKSGGKSFPF